jgi:hypothetical protein
MEALFERILDRARSRLDIPAIRTCSASRRGRIATAKTARPRKTS